MTRKSGVYAIQHLASGRTYIGSSVDIRARWSQHKSALRSGLHVNHALQADWERDGASEFAFVVLEYIEEEVTRHFAEQIHIDKTPLHYNLNHRAGSGPAAGYKHRPESILKMRLAQLGKRKSDAHRKAISEAKKGTKYSAAHRAAIGLGLIGRPCSEETKAKMRAARAKQDRSGVGVAISVAKSGKPWSAARRAAHEQAKCLKVG